MPISISSNELYVKNQDGTAYLPANTIARETTAQQISDIEDAGQAQIDAIETAGSSIADAVNRIGALEDVALNLNGVFRNQLTWHSGYDGLHYTYSMTGVAGDRVRMRVSNAVSSSGTFTGQCRIYVRSEGGSWSSALVYFNYDEDYEYTFRRSFDYFRIRIDGTGLADGDHADATIIYVKNGGSVEYLESLKSGSQSIINIDDESRIQRLTDAGDDSIIKELKIAITPKQQLNGFNKPWIGGNGRNLVGGKPAGATTNNGVTFTVNADGSISTKGTATASTTFRVGAEEYTPLRFTEGQTFVLSGSPANGSGSTYRMRMGLYSKDGDTYTRYGNYRYDNGETISVNPATDAPQSVLDSGIAYTLTQVIIYSGYNSNGLVFWPMLKDTTDTNPDFEPYENICPISGYSEVNVASGTGKNLIDMTVDGGSALNRGLTAEKNPDNSVTVKGHYEYTQAGYVGLSSYTFPIPAGSYILNGCPAGVYSEYGIRLVYGFGNGSRSAQYVAADRDFNVTLDQDESVFVRLVVSDYQAAGDHPFPEEGITFYPMFRDAVDQDNTYAPYVSNISRVISLPTAAGTVYGGTLTIKDDRSAELVVDRGYTVLDGTENWKLHDTIASRFWFPDSSLGVKFDLNNPVVISDKYEGVTYASSMNNGTIAFGSTSLSQVTPRFTVIDKRFTTAADFKAYLAENNLQVVYKLENPVTYKFYNVPYIKTGLNISRIWADCGNIMSISYRMDPKNYIDKKFADILPASGVSF